MWMLAHAGLHDGEWATRAGHDPICLRCPMRVTETLRHALDMLSEDARGVDAPF